MKKPFKILGIILGIVIGSVVVVIGLGAFWLATARDVPVTDDDRRIIVRAMDLIPYDHELNMGGVGVCGPRAGNFAAQNSDLVIAIGTRLSQMITGGKQILFAPKAKKIMVDFDPEELSKFGGDAFKLDLAVQCEVSRFFKIFKWLGGGPLQDSFQPWRARIQKWIAKYPICLPEYSNRKDRVNAYVFVSELSDAAKEGDIIITDAGGNLSWTMQAFKVKQSQRLISAWNHSPMGYSLPASIGASLASASGKCPSSRRHGPWA